MFNKKDNGLRKILFGKLEDNTGKIKETKSLDVVFTAKDDSEEDIKIKFATDDGLILYMFKRIIKLEKRISDLELKYQEKSKSK